MTDAVLAALARLLGGIMSGSKLKLIKPETNTIYRGDNLALMSAFPDNCVDLIYIDPPFFTQRVYKNIWGDREAVVDWEEQTLEGFFDTKKFFENQMNSGESGLPAYLAWMRCRLVELHRMLKPGGSFYIHIDYHAVHYIKVILDEIFGYKNFKNELIWLRGNVKGAKAVGNQFARNHDTLLLYAKGGKDMIFNRQHLPYDEEYIRRYFKRDDGDGRGPYTDQPIGTRSKESIKQMRKDGRIFKTSTGNERIKFYLNEMPGKVIDDVWVDIAEVNSMSKEKTGWPTQKPLALLERIISASTNEGDIVFDAFAGCGTAMHAAHKLKRRWFGVDVSSTAVKVNQKRLEEAKAKVKIVDENDLPVELERKHQAKLKVA